MSEGHTISSPDNDDPEDNRASSALITIHIYLTTGVIMFQGVGYNIWATVEFSELNKLTDLSITVTQSDNPLGSTTQQHHCELNFEQTELLFKTLDDVSVSLPSKKKTNKKKAHKEPVCQDKFPMFEPETMELTGLHEEFISQAKHNCFSAKIGFIYS